MRSQQIIDRKFANFVHVWYGGTCMHTTVDIISCHGDRLETGTHHF